MSVFRFEATPTSSRPNSRRVKSKNKELKRPTFAFSTSPSLLQDITLEKMENAAEAEDSCDSCNSDVAKTDYADASNCDSQAESESESQIDFAEVGMRNSASSGLTMKEYEEQLKKLTAENFNLKLKVYFVEERLSKVIGINDKEDLIKKNIQLKVTCESQLKELEKKQELLFEASKAFELLQKEHAEELEKSIKEKDREISEWEEKFTKLEEIYNGFRSKFSNVENLDDPDADIKSFEDYEKHVANLEASIRSEQNRCKELELMLKDNQLELESYELKSQRMESELDQRMRRVEELVDELEQKEHDLASANFRIRKLEDELKSKQREEEIMKERIEEKNKTIDSLKNSLATRYDTIEALENKLAKERSTSQSMQSKLDSISFQNSRLKEELEILQSRLRRTADSLSPRGKSRATEDEPFKQKYEELMKTTNEQEMEHAKRLKELEDMLDKRNAESEEYRVLVENHKKLEDDHRKACTALKNFIKRSGEEKKEREVLNHMLNSHEEVIADLKAQLDRYRNCSMPRLSQDDKLSLAGTGDNDRNLECPAFDKRIRCLKQDNQFQREISGGDNFPTARGCIKEWTLDVHSTKAEVSNCQLENNNESHIDKVEKECFKEFSVKALESDKREMEKTNAELKKRSTKSQELVDKEARDGIIPVEEQKKKFGSSCEASRPKAANPEHEIGSSDCCLKALGNKLLENGTAPNAGPALLECKLLLGVTKMESLDGFLEDEVADLNVWGSENGGEECRLAKLCGSQAMGREDGERIVRRSAEMVQKDAVRVCALLASRLEELAVFLDSLLRNSKLMNDINLKKREDIREAMEKSRELSWQLSQSFAKTNSNGTSNTSDSIADLSLTLCDSFLGSASLERPTRDKVISEQALIINRLREQLTLLNHEIKQRDIELSHCQGLNRKTSEINIDVSDQDGIEMQTMSICQDLSDDGEEMNSECGMRAVRVGLDKSCRRKPAEKSPSKGARSQETSESEAWSEPDRSVSLARMGRLEDVITVNVSHRNSKCDDSTDSSEETLNENSRPSGKRCRSSESEIRRLQCRVKALDEANDRLRLELNHIKNEKTANEWSNDLLEKESENANLMEKLRETVERLDECSLTCRQLEEKLSEALERASASAVQLSKANETISELEQEISKLREELSVKNTDLADRMQRVAALEKRIEELNIESELKVLDAQKQREAAERKTLEVECKLKDAENMSREVESKVYEIEKKINETKKIKKETVQHFKDAEKHVDTAEKMMEEAEKVKLEAERKSRDLQNFIDLMRKEVEEKIKEAERRIKKSEREKDESEKQVMKLKKKLVEAEKNKMEVEAKVKEGKETIHCMEEKLRELEVALDECNEDAQRKVKEIQKKADAKVAELEMKIEERDWVRKTELEKKMLEAEKISRELETGFRNQLEDAEKRVKKAKEAAEATVKKIQESSKKLEAELRRRVEEVEAEKKRESAELMRQLDEVKLEASEFELELTRLTNEKIHLEEELKKVLDRECAKEGKGKFEYSIHELEDKLNLLALNKSHLASRLEEIESTNFDLVTRISAIRGKEAVMADREPASSATSPTFSSNQGSPLSSLFVDANEAFSRKGSAASDPGERRIHPGEVLDHPRRNMNSSPDLGIESDPGRFSSLEANLLANGEGALRFECSEPLEMKKLESENAELRRRLMRTRQALEETLTQLSAANQRKKQVERAICKQLHKTHHILKKARVNFEAQDGDGLE